MADNEYKAGSNLEKVLSRGEFAVTAELGPPKSADMDVIRTKAEMLAGWIDAVNITDNQTAIVRVSSIAAGKLALDMGLEPIIQMTNLKAKYRPFMIFRPGSDMEVFNVEVRPEYSHFPWWNHWPVAQIISDGRHAQAPDRAAHSSLVWGGPRDDVAIYGMTKNSAAFERQLNTKY